MDRNDINLNYALFLPPEKVKEYFQSKGYAFSFDWYEIWQETHNKVFTVAKAMKLDILQDIRSIVDKAISEGITYEQFLSELEPRLKAKGWWGKQIMFDNDGRLREVQLGSPQRLQTIYYTNLNVAYSVGRYQTMIDNADNRPYWQYKAVMDRNTRLSHAALNNLVYHYKHPFWDTFFPPNDWGCRCWVRPLTKQQVEDMGLKIETEMPDLSNYPPPEWSYNPGKKAFKPDLSKYDKDLRDLIND